MLPFPRWPGFALAISLLLGCNATATPLSIFVPAVHSVQLLGRGDFVIGHTLHVLVDEVFANSTLDNGLTLIPPTLNEFADIFAADIKELFPQVNVVVSPTTATDVASSANSVFLTLSSKLNSTTASGAPTTEGYTLTVMPTGVHISGAGVKGVFWGTRTLLQGLIQRQGRFPASTITDQPDWPTRGLKYSCSQSKDAGRHWYPIAFLKEMCAYLSWFKMSEFHLHLSDNVNPMGHANAYARFRLHSENASFAGLTPFVNETYSRTEFDDLQQSCALRGVTIIPEIEAPGHALVVTQWKPELALTSDPTLLNLTLPDTVPTMKDIWREFLPWFHTKQVHIGADEYDASLADDYNNFVNEMSNFMQMQSGKQIRLWSTNEPSNTTSVSKMIIKQHWEFFEGDPFQLIRDGYEVVNSEDSIHYIVMKSPPTPGSYPQRLNQTRLWDGANVDTGGIWDPHIFDRGNASNNPSITEPLLPGSIIAVWNDHGPNASTPLEAFYAVKEGVPVIAAANWQAAARPNHLTHAQFLQAYPVLEARAPGQNLDRRIPSKLSLIAEYRLSGTERSGSPIKDLSGNGYDARMQDGIVDTPLGSKGANYTLLISASRVNASGVLLSGPDTSFSVVAAPGNSHTLAFNSTNILYPLPSFVFGQGKDPTEIILQGTENSTRVWVNGGEAGEFVVGIDGTDVLQPMAFVAPAQQLQGVDEFVLWDGLQDVSIISRNMH